MTPKVKVWVMFGNDLKFGEGRARLLEVIEARGSLQQAAREFAMSYRNAWGYLRDLERAAGFKFVHRVPGGGRHGGMRLTTEGKRFVADYRRFNTSLARISQRCFALAFRGDAPTLTRRSRPRARI